MIHSVSILRKSGTLVFIGISYDVPEPPFTDHYWGPFSYPVDDKSGRKMFFDVKITRIKIISDWSWSQSRNVYFYLPFFSLDWETGSSFLLPLLNACWFSCVGSWKDWLHLLDEVEKKKFLNDAVPVKLSGPVWWHIARRQINDSVNNENNYHWYCSV